MAAIPTEHLLTMLFTNAKAGTPSPGLAGVLTGAKMGLYKTLISATVHTVLADITKADFNTYAEVNAVFGLPYRRASGGIAVSSAFIEWQMSDALVPNTIYGYYIVDSGATNLLITESFGTSGINLTDVLDAINVSCEFCLGGLDFGQMSLSV